MKFSKEQEQMIVSAWHNGAQLDTIARDLNKLGVTTPTGLPIRNKHVSKFCINRGLRRQKNKKPFYAKKRRAIERMAAKGQLTFPVKSQVTGKPIAVMNQLATNKEVLAAVMSSNDLSQDVKLSIIKQIMF